MRGKVGSGSFVEIEDRAGRPIVKEGMRIIPIARSLRVNIPGLPGGLVWNRPVSVVAQMETGEEKVLPVRDVTRQIQLALLAGTLVGMLSLWLAMRLRNGDQKR